MRRALVQLLLNASLFRLRGKRSRAPPAREIMGVTVEQAHCSELATVTVVPDRRRPFSAEVPSGPIRSCVVVTEVIAAPLHWTPSAPGKLPTAVATNTRESPEHIKNGPDAKIKRLIENSPVPLWMVSQAGSTYLQHKETPPANCRKKRPRLPPSL